MNRKRIRIAEFRVETIGIRGGRQVAWHYYRMDTGQRLGRFSTRKQGHAWITNNLCKRKMYEDLPAITVVRFIGTATPAEVAMAAADWQIKAKKEE